MAITGAIYKALEFDGESSRAYGVYITGEAVFNAPERAVEMISIPGRNGAFALDQGRFENITVSYPAGIFADTEADFADAISDFRNFLCSRSGYCRLVDEYNPNEYRMAIYKSGLEVSPAQLRAGEFEIVFECKPQRFLTSGEEAVEVTSGDTITNPTRFEARPLIEATGHGTITLNGKTITLHDALVGYVVLSSGGAIASGDPLWLDLSLVGDNDYINIENLTIRAAVTLSNNVPIDSISFSGVSSPFSASSTILPDGLGAELYFSAASISIKKQPDYIGGQWTINFVQNGVTTSISVPWIVYFDTTANAFISYLDNATEGGITITQRESFVEKIDVNSTASVLGNPTYIDCDIGEAYKKTLLGDIVSLNGLIELGAELPVLSSGENAITFTNEFTKVAIVPRWWKV